MYDKEELNEILKEMRSSEDSPAKMMALAEKYVKLSFGEQRLLRLVLAIHPGDNDAENCDLYLEDSLVSLRLQSADSFHVQFNDFGIIEAVWRFWVMPSKLPLGCRGSQATPILEASVRLVDYQEWKSQGISAIAEYPVVLLGTGVNLDDKGGKGCQIRARLVRAESMI